MYRAHTIGKKLISTSKFHACPCLSYSRQWTGGCATRSLYNNYHLLHSTRNRVNQNILPTTLLKNDRYPDRSKNIPVCFACNRRRKKKKKNRRFQSPRFSLLCQSARGLTLGASNIADHLMIRRVGPPRACRALVLCRYRSYGESDAVRLFRLFRLFRLPLRSASAVVFERRSFRGADV